MNKLLIFFLFGCWMPSTSWSVNQEDPLVVRFENLTVKDRLPSQRVLCVWQDQKGFMWFGTEEGLCRYDGHEFIEFFADINDRYSLRNQAIRSIVEDRFGNLWIGTDGGGLHYFNQKTWKFYSYPLPYQPLDNEHSKPGFIYAILRTSDETYWIGSYGQGLYHLSAYDSPEEVITKCENQDTEDIIQILPNGQENGLNDLNVYCLYEDSRGDIWIGTDDYGTAAGGALHRLRTDLHAEERYTFVKYRSVPGDPSTLGSNYIMSVFEDAQNRFWVCNWEGGLNLLDRETGQVQQFRQGDSGPFALNSDDVYSITEDRNGILWMATYGGGISRIREGNHKLEFIPYTHDPNNENSLIGDLVRQIFVDHGGLLWAITWKSGISRIRVNQNPFIHIPLPGHSPADTLTEIVRDMRVLSGSAVVLYTEEQGFMVLNPDADRGAFSFSELNDPRQWPERAIYSTEFARKYATDRTFRNLIQDSRAYLEDSQGSLWFAKEQMLYRLDISEDGRYSQSNFERNSQNPVALKGYHVTGIVEDADGQIWVSTMDGLNRYQSSTQSFIHFTMKDGLPGNAISAMVIDRQNFLWLATENGLARFDPRYGGVMIYDRADGLPFTEFCSRVTYGMEDFQELPAYLQLPDGSVMISSIRHGILYFDPESIFRDMQAPRTWITGLRIMNELVRPDQLKTAIRGDEGMDIVYARSLVLGPEEQNFSFSVSVLDYFNPGQSQFAYRMLPVYETWRYMSPGVESVNFSMLPAGDYVFEVKGANGDGIWTEVPTRLPVHITSHWYNRLWFRLVILTILLLAGTVIMIRSKQRSQILQALHLEKMRREEQDRFTQMRLNFYTNVTHEFRTQLTLILGPLGNMERKLTDEGGRADLSIMKRNGLRLLNLVNQLMDFRKIESRALHLQVEQGNLTDYIQGICELFGENILSRQIQFEFHSDPEEITGYFDRSAIDKIVFNLLSNAFKFTEKRGQIRVYLQTFHTGDTTRARIRISDTGKGIPEHLIDRVFDRFFQGDQSQPGSGIGLSIVRSLTDMHHGEIQIQSKPGTGTEVTVDIPVSREAFNESDISDRRTGSSADFSAFRPAIINHTEGEASRMPIEAQNKPTVLIVEDNADMLSYISGIVQDQYRVQRAMNAESALRIIESREPDLILTDLMMSGIGGLEMVRMLKQDVRFSHIPIIIISALEGRQNEITGLQLGAEDFIHKPFDPEVLLAKMQNRLKSRKQFREEFRSDRTEGRASQTVGEQDQEFLNKLIGQIDQHYANASFGVKSLVQLMGMSHSVLLRKVKSLTGQSINELIVVIRLEKAHEILQSGNQPIKEVAYQVGFSDPKYFSIRFKKKYGCSPSELN